MQHSIKDIRLNNPSALGILLCFFVNGEILKMQSSKHKCEQKALLKSYDNMLFSELIIKAFFYGNRRGL